MSHQIKQHHWLKACDYLGIHPLQISDGQLDLNVVYFTQKHYCEILSGKITIELAPNKYLDMQIHPKFLCPTCMTILNKPQRQLAGISECCHRVYCNQSRCMGGDQLCPICSLPVCRFCGQPLPGMGTLLFHKIECHQLIVKHVYSLNPDDPFPLLKKSLQDMWKQRRKSK